MLRTSGYRSPLLKPLQGAIFCVSVLGIRALLVWGAFVAGLEPSDYGPAGGFVLFGVGAVIALSIHLLTIFALTLRPLVGAALATFLSAAAIVSALADWNIAGAVTMLFAVGTVYLGWRNAEVSREGLGKD